MTDGTGTEETAGGGDTRRVVALFGEIAAIPHCSGNEEALAAYLMRWGKEHGCSVRQDGANNVFLDKPGSPGCEDAPPVVLQAHMDMVCVKATGEQHNFAREGIDWYEEDGTIRARGTSLGADNGIGLAMGLALLADARLIHPPLQLIATTEEETTMHGAESIDPALVAGTTIINLDDEKEGAFTVSSAGMLEARFSVPAHRIRVAGDVSWQTVEVAGGRGGHSGIEIHTGRANALVLLSGILADLMQETGCAVASITGGDRANVIPGHAVAVIGLDSAARGAASRLIREEERLVRGEYRVSDPDLRIRIFPASPQESVLMPEAATTMVTLLSSLPAGVLAMDPEIPGLVATSANPAICSESAGIVNIGISARSNDDDELTAVGDRLRAMGHDVGVPVEILGVSPAWQRRETSPLRDIMVVAYRDLFGTDPEVRALHAGLEAAQFARKRGDADIIAVGPNIYDAHTPRESVSVVSIGRVYRLLSTVLARLAKVAGTS